MIWLESGSTPYLHAHLQRSLLAARLGLLVASDGRTLSPRRAFERQSLSRRMRAPVLAAAALLAVLAQPGAAHPRLIWGASGVNASRNGGVDASSSSWLLSLRDRSHAAALCAEAEGRRGPLRRFLGACAPPLSGRIAPLGTLHFRPAGADAAKQMAQLAALLRAFPAHVLEFAERDSTVRLADVTPLPSVPAESSANASGLAPGARGVQRCGRELHALDRVDQAALPLDGAYAPPWWPSGQKALTGAGVRVYVLDTGVRASHAELRGRVAPGVDLVDPNGHSGGDLNGHGTHVAACVAGARFGAAKGASIVPVRVLDAAGESAWSRVLAGLDWVAQHHAAAGGGSAVALLSLAGGRSLAAERAAAALAAAGVLPVVAAGNAGGDACGSSPGGGGASLVVGAASADDARAAFSNSGGCVDVFAPGTDVLSAWAVSDDATKAATGTSSAAPLAAAAAALFLEAAPGAAPQEVKAAIAAAASAGVLAGATLGAGSPNRMLSVAALGAAADARAAAVTAAAGSAGGEAGSWTLALRPAAACAAAAAAQWGAWEACDAACGWGRQRRSRANAPGCAAAATQQTRTCFAGGCGEL